MVLVLRDLNYESRLTECGLTTQETRILRGDQIEVFEIVNGKILIGICSSNRIDRYLIRAGYTKMIKLFSSQ